MNTLGRFSTTVLNTFAPCFSQARYSSSISVSVRLLIAPLSRRGNWFNFCLCRFMQQASHHLKRYSRNAVQRLLAELRHIFEIIHSSHCLLCLAAMPVVTPCLARLLLHQLLHLIETVGINDCLVHTVVNNTLVPDHPDIDGIA